MKRPDLFEQYKIHIEDDMFNAVYLPYRELVKRYEIYYGGAGSGKSHFIAQKLAIQLTMMEGRNLVVLRKQAVDCRDSCYPMMHNAMEDMNLLQFWHIVEHPLVRMTCWLNGNTILFNGVDDIENIKSIKFKVPENAPKTSLGNLTDVWYEEASEETTPNVIKELDRRLRDKYHQCRILVSFNPIFLEHWLKKWMEHIENGKRKNFIILKTTYIDNKDHLPEEYIQMLEDYRTSSPYDYQVYALGNWGVMGQSVFDVNKIAQRLEILYAQTDRYIRQVDFDFSRTEKDKPDVSTIQAYETDMGDTVIYEEPIPRTPYVVAIDTAGEGDDYFTAQVINNITKNQAAVFHSQKTPPWCTHQVFCLCHYYNVALAVPEANFNVYVVEKFIEYEYPLIYQRNKPVDVMEYGYERKYGFLTTVTSRPRILSRLIEYVAKNVNTINDVGTLNEFLSFTVQAKRVKSIWWGASPGAHDDLVMSYAIALEGFSQQDETAIPDRTRITGIIFPEVLAQRVRSGEVEEETAREYMREHKDFMQVLIGDVDSYDFGF